MYRGEPSACFPKCLPQEPGWQQQRELLLPMGTPQAHASGKAHLPCCPATPLLPTLGALSTRAGCRGEHTQLPLSFPNQCVFHFHSSGWFFFLIFCYFNNYTNNTRLGQRNQNISEKIILKLPLKSLRPEIHFPGSILALGKRR